MRRAAGGYVAAERWLGARVPVWVGLPWLRLRRTATRGAHYARGRARRARGSLATSHRHGSTTVRRLRRQLVREAAVTLAYQTYMTRASVAWAEGVLS